jgi:hypothetical protein
MEADISTEEVVQLATVYYELLGRAMRELGIPPGGPAALALLGLAADSFVRGPHATRETFLRGAASNYDTLWRAVRGGEPR